MLARVLLSAAVGFVGVDSVYGQTSPKASEGPPPATWQNPTGDVGPVTASDRASSRLPERTVGPSGSAANRSGQAAGESARGEAQPPIVRGTTGDVELPREHGQLWKTYDITPYTLRVTSTNRPERAIIDWILRETGYEAWHSEPLAILNADQRTLWAYHTPEMQQIVADVVNRFVSTQADTQAFSLRVVTLSHPSWRARAQRLLRPVPVQTPGVQAWLLHQEDAALLLSELRRRPDFREHSSPHLLVNNGQSTVVSATRARSYIRNAVLRTDPWPAFEPETAMADEGFSLEFSPLLSVDGQVIDATVKCQINQVEKMISISLDVPAAAAPRQRAKIEVPQMSQFHFHERFRWPVEQVLLVGMGMVALPIPSEGESLIPGLPLPLPKSPPRADLLVFVESRGKAADRVRVTGARRSTAGTYSGRY